MKLNIKSLKLYLDRLFPSNQVKVKIDSTNAVFRTKSFEDKQYFKLMGGEEKAFRNYVKNILKTDTILDCGGFHGLYTIFSGLKAIDGKVFVVEPDINSRESLYENIRLNNLKNVIVISNAISDKNIKVSLAANEEHGWSPRLSKLTDIIPSPRKFNNTISVQGITFSNLVSQEDIAKTDVLKVDIEGAETFIFNKKWKTLVFNKIFSPRIIFLEIHPLYISQLGSSPEVIENIILSSGYKCIFSENKANEINKIYKLI